MLRMLNTADLADFENSKVKVSVGIANFHMVEAQHVQRYLIQLVLNVKLIDASCIRNKLND